MTDQTYPPVIPGARPDPRIFAATDQAFLVGETIFLRGLEEEDAVRASGWRDSPYPINAERAGELIKEQTEKSKPGTRMLVACRRSDGEPVGSLTMARWPGNDLDLDLKLYANPALPGEQGVRAEMLKLIVDWGFSEGELPIVYTAFAEEDTELRATAGSLGMRHGAMWREKLWRDGAWRHEHMYVAHNPAWLARLGDPGTGIDHALDIDDPSRWRPRQYPTYGTLDGDPPTNAVVVGPRVYLRPLELTDAPGMVAGDRRERETFFDEGRLPGSVARMRHHIREVSKEDPPEWVRFAVCLRDTGEHIGTNGLSDLDLINRTAETETFFHSADHRGSGYGSEAKQLLLAYAFERLGLHSVYSWVWGPNTRSAAALRKQGYRECGRVFWAGTKDGEYTHAYTFDFLAEEWREMTARAAADQLAVAR